MDDAELALLVASRDSGLILELAVTGCNYSCCGRGWHRRAEGTYHGTVLQLSGEDLALANKGVGTLSYVIACKLHEIEAVAVR